MEKALLIRMAENILTPGDEFITQAVELSIA